ncbi:MAG: MATE family efflux transporter [SAR324 cluster bacterium]|uniref:Multidrug-efflux transporter n=1 Tax=SAR324 cluster bacterium TaxID=2024889 RepID=A0A2A4T5G9_9DELT|nr:MAG: MATE family efflux transporter [SAR324 cluster bacterium]
MFNKEKIKEIIILATPVVIGQLGHVMMSVVDNIMVGKLGTIPLAAAALANSLFMVIMIVGFGISLAITPLVAIAEGSGKQDECGIILRQGLIVCVAAGLVLALTSMFTAELMPYMNQPAEVVPLAQSYLKILAWSILPVMLFQNYRQFSEGLSLMRPAMVITLVANVLNVFVNWVFIFGHMGLPAMGLDGAGFATFTARTFMGLAMMAYVMRSPRLQIYDPSLRFRKLDWPLMNKILKIGLPIGGQMFFEVSAFAGASVLAGWLGANALAAHQIALNLASITFMFAVGIAATATVLVANAVGKGDSLAARQSGFNALFFGLLMMSCFTAYYLTAREFLPSLYSSDPQVIGIAASLLVIAGIFQLSDGTQAIALGALRGLTDVKIPTVITFLAFWGFGLPVSYLFGFILDFGIEGIWWGLLSGLTASAILLTLRFYRQTKQNFLIPIERI